LARILLNNGRKIPREPSRDILRKSREMQKRRLRRLLIFWGVVFLSVAGALVALLHQPFVTVQNIVVKGNELTRTEDIEQAVEEAMSGSYGFVVPKRSIFFVPTGQIEQALYERFPRFDEVEVNRTGPTSLAVNVHERRADMLWCVDSALAATSTDPSDARDECYFLDPTGLVIARAPYFTPGIFFELYTEPLSEPLGKQPISQKDLDNLRHLAAVLPEALRSLPDSPYYPDHVQVKGGEYIVTVASRTIDRAAWQLRLSAEQSAVDIVANLRSVLSSEAFIADYAARGGAVDYMDLRFGKKVFYKFKE